MRTVTITLMIDLSLRQVLLAGWPPEAHKGFELGAISKGVRVMLERGKDSEHRDHVGRDRSIDSPQLRQIEAATLVGVPPGQQKGRDFATLAGIALSDAD